VPDVPDYELLKSSDEPPIEAPRKRPVGMWLIVAALCIAAAVAAYVLVGRRQAPATSEEAPIAGAQPAAPLGGTADPIAVPPLDESDAVFRQLVSSISSHPTIAAWLATDGLIRGFTVAVVTIAEGKTPARDLRVLRPSAPFGVVDQDGELTIDPRSYKRYDDLASAAASMDPEGTAKLYATIKPRIEEAYRELGLANTPFDQTLERAIVLLLETPIDDEPATLEPKGIGYRFADAELEALTGAQRQLLRMGPDNARVVQAALRRIALALGIPAQRLPPQRT
jgi:hypothetical protein